MDATRKRGWWIAAIVAAVVLVVGIVVWAIVGSGGGAADPDASGSPSPSVSGSATPLPTPTPGTTDSIDVPPAVEVPLDEVAEPVEGVTVEIVSMEPFTVDSAAPGELAGPALKIVVSVTNATSASLNTAGATLTLAYGPDATPAPDVGDPVVSGLPNTIAAGATATGEYSFSIPLDQRATVRVTLDLLNAEPEILFVGSAP